MIILRRIRKAVRNWQAKRRERILRQALPAIMDRKNKIAAARVRHGKVKPIVIQQQSDMLHLLRGR